jgi:predicted acyl esterase
MTHRSTAIVAALALTLAACSGSDSAAPPTTTATPATTTPDAEPPATTGAPTASTAPGRVEIPAEEEIGKILPGTEQVTLLDAPAGTSVHVIPASDEALDSFFNPAPGTTEPAAGGEVDEYGSLVVRHLEGGEEYRLIYGDEAISAPFTTLQRDVHPDASFYAEQRLPTDGLGYITTRDGTTLSASVWLPGPAEDGPYPTVVEYSGYSPSNPESEGFPDIFTALGYAYVGVNIRGTGCSGGSFRYFEYVQSLDGYDAVEAVAAQPWVMNNRVGMVGISYPGISQLFVGQTQPPSLAAITPLSVLADSAISTLYPGGILNTGFAVPWTAERMEQARPNGQGWSVDQIDAGDEVCAANQEVRLQNPDLLTEITQSQFWTDEVAGEIAPRLFVDKINVPTFLAGAWQDEQTGGHFATMLDRFTGTDHFYATLLNGLHTESISPAVFPRLVEFLDLYVAERTPSLGVARIVGPLLASNIFGTDQVSLPAEDRFAGMSYEDALATFEAEPPIRVLFEEGAADGELARAPMARFEAAFDAWPVPEAEVAEWYLGVDGALDTTPREDSSEVSYLALPDAIPPTWFDEESGNIWSVDVTYDWQEGGAGTYAAWATPPLADETVVVGSGSVDLFIQSNLGDTDLEVTITEIRPDGNEVYVQSGWLRASQRALDESASTELRPVHTHREEDAAPLPDGEFAEVRVELFPFAHVFRAGSRIRLVVDAPGGNRPVWEFDTISGGEEVTIAVDPVMASKLVLPVVASVDAPDAYPACDSLRGQPCRVYAGP